MVDAPAERALRRAARRAVVAQILLVVAGLRHHLVWGESLTMPFPARPLLDAMEALCVVAFAGLGGLAWWRGMAGARAAAPGLRRLVLLSLPILFAAVAVPPFLSADVIDYVVRGRVLSLHGANPYVHVATAFPEDPFLAFGDPAWKDFPLPYGPVVAVLQGGIAWLAHLAVGLSPRVELVFAVVLFKLLFAGCLLLAAVVARAIAGLLRPAQRDAAFVGVLWSPLLLGECVAQAHNEALVLLPLLAAVWWSLRGRIALGTFALGGAVLTKFVPVVLGPVWLVWAWQQRRTRALAAGLVAVGALAGGACVLFFREAGALQFLQRQSQVTGASFVWAATAGLQLVGLGTAQWIGRAVVVSVALVAALRLWTRPEPVVFVRGGAAVMATTACCLGIFGPWYHVWWVPLALLAGPGHLQRFAIAATCCAPLGYLVWAGLRRFDDLHQWVMLGLAIVLPAAIAIGWPLVHHTRAERLGTSGIDR